MNKIELIATDLDGTLLRSDKTVSDYTREILRRCRAAGVKTVYATGRGGSADKVAPSALFDGKITMNGAVGKIGDKVIYNRLIPYKDARPVLTACDRRGIKASSEISGIHYANFDVFGEWPDIAHHERYEQVDFAVHVRDAEKLYALVRSPEDIAYIESVLPPGLYVSVSRDGMAMIMHGDATKSKALLALAGVWGIDAKKIAAFGDDLNDMDMLSAAGYGVATENALDEVKAIAGHNCPANDEDGVAAWIEREVLR